MGASRALHEEVEKYKAWAASHMPPQRGCDYDQWQSLWGAAIAVLESVPPDEWSERCRADLIFAIARDDEVEWISDQLGGKPGALLALAGLAIDSSEPDAKWQIAAQLGTLSTHKDKAEEMLLRLVDDTDEYVSRRALLALGALKSQHAEHLAERAWLTGHEYQRIAALWVLRDVAPSKLPKYLRSADEDGRKFVVENARKCANGIQ
ncbi:HEAT repeat domain-containing protein [Ralstonia mannitolilytica]|uniref:HEAT repeat domain-containing protein n=1 Tax=Ralstonia mannitolilytica TaxID=105219 RepID=UPI001315AA9C|nr:HEAT repeat domain-containing protein [Ralstonia mannitolilytica]MBU9580602.1 HEAT repeat domain-containing protein [Ralstonia mannitolilytica]